MSPKVIALLLVSVSLGSVGQFFFKKGMSGHGTVSLGPEIIKFLFTPMVFVGLICYGLATLCWLSVLSQAPLSIAYPSISISYIVVVFMSQFIFKEVVSWVSWAGVLLIVGGVVLVGVGGQMTKDAATHPEPTSSASASP